jgi:hypothetical protein
MTKSIIDALNKQYVSHGAMTKSAIDTLNKRYENLDRAKIVKDLKTAVTFVFAFSIAFPGISLLKNFTELSHEMIGWKIGNLLVWGVGLLWVFTRKSRLGAIILCIIATMVLISNLKNNTEYGSVLDGMLLLASVYIYALASKFQKMKRHENDYWDYHFPFGSVVVEPTVEETKAILEWLKPEQKIEVSCKSFHQESTEETQAFANALAKQSNCSIEHSAVKKTVVFSKLYEAHG